MGSRGGLGSRKSLAERLERSRKYQLVGVKAGSPVAECNNRLRRWDLGYRMGVILRNSGASVTIQWEGDDEFTFYSGEEARYLVDTNMWRIGEAKGKSPIDALTTGSEGHSIEASPRQGGTRNNSEEKRMATTRKSSTSKKTEPKKDTEAKVEAPKEEPKKDENGNVERDTYTAKQVATRINTDAKTLRKFFRSPASTVEAVGQGGRYEFDAADLPKIKEEFEAWQKGKTPRATKKANGEKESRSPRELEVDIEDEEELELEDDPELNFEDEDEEPTEEDLSDLEDDVEEDEDLDIEEEEEEDDEDDEDDEEGHTREELQAMTLPKLRMLAESDYDLDIKGLKKAQVVDAILKHERGE